MDVQYIKMLYSRGGDKNNDYTYCQNSERQGGQINEGDNHKRDVRKSKSVRSRVRHWDLVMSHSPVMY